MNKRKIHIGALMLSATICWASPLCAETASPMAAENLKVTQKKIVKETALGKMAVTTTFRGGVKILEQVTPPDESMNTVFYVFLNGFKVFTYKSGPMGTEFSGAGMGRRQIKPEYTIKMAGDKWSIIKSVTIYSADYKTTFDGFRVKDGELIPWSAEKLASWRKLRSEAPNLGQ